MSTDPILTAAEAEAVVARRISEVRPPRQPSRVAGELPRFLALAGQPGAGKTTAQEQIRALLGRETTAVYVATSKADSTLGVANRYQQGRDANGVGRWVALADTQYLFEPLRDTIVAVERNAVFDDLYVADRQGHVLHENHVADASGRLLHDLGAGTAIDREQNRPPTESENRQFLQTAHYLLEGRDPRLGPLDPQVEEMVRTAMSWQRERGTPIPDHVLINPSLPTIGERLSVGTNTLTPTEQAGFRAATLPHGTSAQRSAAAAAGESPAHRTNTNRRSPDQQL